MKDNHYEKISTWLSTYPKISGWLFFNVTNMEADSTSLNSVPGERIKNQYIDGSTEKEQLFAIDMVKNFSTGTSDQNLDAIHEALNIADWCEEQSGFGNLPDFADCIMEGVEILDSAPSASVDNDAGLIKYQIQGKVTYIEL